LTLFTALCRLNVKCCNQPRYEHPPKSGKWFFKFDVDTSLQHIGAYTGHGQVVQVILPETASFDPLSHSLASPGKNSMAFFFQPWTLQPPIHLHIAFAAFNALSSTSASPLLPTDPDAFLSACRAAHAALPSASKDMCGPLNEDVMRAFSRTCCGKVNPVSAVAGGIAAQEAIKACSQKFRPMSDPQWLYFDALEAAPRDSGSHCCPQSCRYDGQLAIFGRSLQDVLGRMKVFLVGAGALGCELLKNFALMGVGCGEEGKIVVTDNDHIEKSNLSRQFLFRNHHIGKGKSACAAVSAKAINSSLRSHHPTPIFPTRYP
jgi:ubiquitin-activating enzyme E1